jgi:hypothetical protein
MSNNKLSEHVYLVKIRPVFRSIMLSKTNHKQYLTDGDVLTVMSCSNV